jgi:hypothetical protein
VLSPFDLTPGHALAPVTFVITAEEARAYIQAVDDTSVLYHQAAAPLPPLLLAARGLQLLMAQVEIPAGTVHGGQECEFLQPTYADRELRLTVSAPRAATRQGQRFVTLEMHIFDGAAPVCRARASLIVPLSDGV